jgi:hypothetical protein
MLISAIVFLLGMTPNTVEAKAKKTAYSAIKIKNIRQKKKLKGLKINIAYPQITGLKDAAIQKKVNSLFKDRYYNYALTRFKDLSIDPSCASGCVVASESTHVMAVNERYVSVIVTYYGFTGGAHGNWWGVISNIDLKTGRPFSTQDAFKDDILPAINNRIEKVTPAECRYADDIKGKLVELKNLSFWIKNGKDKKSITVNFVIEDENVVPFFYMTYRDKIDPDEMETCAFTFPLSELKPYIKEKGPLGRE